MRRPTIHHSLLAAVLLIVLPASAGAITPCERSANQLRRACLADSNDDRFEGWAVCTHIADFDDRRACADAVNEEADEKKFEECAEVFEARADACELLGEFRHVDPLTDPANEFVDLDEIGETVEPNRYFPLEVGRTDVLRTGEEFEELVVITVTDETKEFSGVECRVVVAVEMEVAEDGGDDGDDDELTSPGNRLVQRQIFEYELLEVTEDYYAQTTNGDVVYCGEDSTSFGDQGISEGNDGSFFSGNEDRAHAGWLLRNDPPVGVAERQEMALGEAEDIVEYLDGTAIPEEENDLFPCAPDGCLMTHDSNPLEPGDTEFKYYREGVGFVLAVALEDGEPAGETEELQCFGDSLDVLLDPACGVEDVDELFATLCSAHFEAFCEVDEE